MSITNKALFLAFGGLFLLSVSCQKDYMPAEPVAKVATQTNTLEAWQASTPPNKISSPFWKTANYFLVNPKDISKGLLYGDGLLNMTGTFNGLTSFSDPKLTLKAAYDNENIYILAEWNDPTVDISQGSWFYDGKKDPLKSAESDTGWTSQKNNDKLAFAFEINSAGNGTETFASKGCVAACHGTGSSTVMSPTTGTVDLWSWNLATSAPLGYMHDMNANSTGMNFDAGTSFVARNNAGSTDRSGPAYEWDGTEQSVTLPNGTTSVLNPAFYLINKTPMPGSAISGKDVYYKHGDCANSDCHGDAQYFDAKKYTGYTRAGLMALMAGVGEMQNYWANLSAKEKDDIVTFIRSIAGVPGYVLSTPTTGKSNTDITVVTNVTPAQIANAKTDATNIHTKYQVLITRKLKTTYADDIQFDLSASRTYNFGVALMNNDGKNHIGSEKEVLTFK